MQRHTRVHTHVHTETAEPSALGQSLVLHGLWTASSLLMFCRPLCLCSWDRQKALPSGGRRPCLVQAVEGFRQRLALEITEVWPFQIPNKQATTLAHNVDSLGVFSPLYLTDFLTGIPSIPRPFPCAQDRDAPGHSLSPQRPAPVLDTSRSASRSASS